MDSVALPITSSPSFRYRLQYYFKIYRSHLPTTPHIACNTNFTSHSTNQTTSRSRNFFVEISTDGFCEFVHMPSFNMTRDVFLRILSVRSLYLDHCRLVEKSPLRLTQSSCKLSPHSGIRLLFYYMAAPTTLRTLSRSKRVGPVVDAIISKSL